MIAIVESNYYRIELKWGDFVMQIKQFSPRSPGTRHRTSLTFKDLSNVKPLSHLVSGKKGYGGRNKKGRTTLKGRGGGHKRKTRYADLIFHPKRSIDYAHEKTPRTVPLSKKRNNFLLSLDEYFRLTRSNASNPSREYKSSEQQETSSPAEIKKLNYLTAKVMTLEYDPTRTARLALLNYPDGSKSYMRQASNLKKGDSVYYGELAPRSIGTTRPIGRLPLGCITHNVELRYGKGGQIARAAGTFTQLLAKGNTFVTITMPSGEVRLVHAKCRATIGQVGNIEARNVTIGKAGRSRWLGRRPKTRGVAKNPNDHPHGGGEGRSPIGRKYPVTPWGKPALGVKTRSKKKKSSDYILRSRSKK
jgi:large subunit ribosomal protein L2